MRPFAPLRVAETEVSLRAKRSNLNGFVGIAILPVKDNDRGYSIQPAPDITLAPFRSWRI